ncbi:hypothetical protein GLE_5066 [Lysobacter enzymogenes]|uniref:Uncharacterized protein n=1 Tax=Lysobacter enzymogenes TaxID=69 RepID=A0A0S2DP18_LYSEN|nr:hypothetical protein GLE_5066 [Lysobacter enzymogenes]
MTLPQDVGGASAPVSRPQATKRRPEGIRETCLRRCGEGLARIRPTVRRSGHLSHRGGEPVVTATTAGATPLLTGKIPRLPLNCRSGSMVCAGAFKPDAFVSHRGELTGGRRA